MRKGKVENYIKKYYKDYYLFTQRCYRRIFFDTYSKEDLEKYLNQIIKNSKIILDEFKLIKQIERENSIYTTIMPSFALDSVKLSNLYQLDNIKPSRYIELYHLYCLLSCIEIFNDIEQFDFKEQYYLTKADYQSEIAEWKKEFSSFKEYFNRVDLIGREYTLNKFISHYSNMQINFYHIKSRILDDMNITDIAYEDEELQDIYKYMLYYLLPTYLQNDEYKNECNKISCIMLKELDPFVNDDIIDKIRVAAKDFVDQKKAKEKSKK